MTHSGLFATSDEILVKAGKAYDTGITEARINTLCLEVESYINSVSRYNWSDAYAGLNVDVKHLLSMLESDLVAMYIINYNMSVYASRSEAETMLNALRDRVSSAVKLIKEEANKRFIQAA